MPWTAYAFATGKSPSRVKLVKRFKVSDITQSTDRFYQGEVLIKGIVVGATPIAVSK